ncbi:MAG TPA: rRNA maturation RNase YbeY [Clostridiales bacterium]|nr:rRNA maturation RNase YbeY [Clostridiales bacterium]
MDILIDNRQNIVHIDKKTEELIYKTVLEVLKQEAVELDVEVSIILIDNEQIRELNRKYRGIDKATDVLSFPMLEEGLAEYKVGRDVCPVEDFDNGMQAVLLGDIAVSMEKVVAQAEEYGHSRQRELSFLIVHGMLHLLGYDHRHPEDMMIMREREEKILSSLNMSR